MADALRKARARRRDVLQKGLVACYERIDSIRQELAELDAADRNGIPMDPQRQRELAATRGVSAPPGQNESKETP